MELWDYVSHFAGWGAIFRPTSYPRSTARWKGRGAAAESHSEDALQAVYDY